MQLAETIKLRLYPTAEQELAFSELSYWYMEACNFVSDYVFSHGFCTNSVRLSAALYSDIRSKFGLKSQMSQSAIRTVTARYQTVDTQMKNQPHKFKCDGKYYTFRRDITWLQKPIAFRRPQADLVRNRDFSFAEDKERGELLLSLNTLAGRVRLPFAHSDYFEQKFLNGGWQFGTGKLVCMKGRWYFHISATREVQETQREDIQHVVGIDRGLRFLAATYDDKQNTAFFSGKKIIEKRNKFDAVRAELQSKGTKSAKRALKRISGRENRWMSDVNHCISKTLVRKYGPNTLYVLEDLTGVSFEEENQHGRKQTHDLRNWSFYDLETKLSYKAKETGGRVLKVDPHYTSQRCPHCGAIVKESRDHDKHVYTCRKCGFSSNDDRVGAMNIYLLGTLWVVGEEEPHFALKERSEAAEIS